MDAGHPEKVVWEILEVNIAWEIDLVAVAEDQRNRNLGLKTSESVSLQCNGPGAPMGKALQITSALTPLTITCCLPCGLAWELGTMALTWVMSSSC